jgi:hypothetical protein
MVEWFMNAELWIESTPTDSQVDDGVLSLLSWIPPAAAAYISKGQRPLTQAQSAVADNTPYVNCMHGIVMCGIAITFAI